jgi:hypothetical protein
LRAELTSLRGASKYRFMSVSVCLKGYKFLVPRQLSSTIRSASVARSMDFGAARDVERDTGDVVGLGEKYHRFSYIVGRLLTA